MNVQSFFVANYRFATPLSKSYLIVSDIFAPKNYMKILTELFATDKQLDSPTLSIGNLYLFFSFFRFSLKAEFGTSNASSVELAIGKQTFQFLM